MALTQNHSWHSSSAATKFEHIGERASYGLPNSWTLTRPRSHYLAPISGSISRKDKDPLTAAWREMSEETSLTPLSLEFWRKGKPYTFDDFSVGRQWTIYPFAFRLKDASDGGGEDAIHIDWEHESWEWYDPNTVVDNDQFGGVPRLRESLRRVWFECDMNSRAAKVLATGLETLQKDHESGARELTAIALGVFRDVVTQMGNGLDEPWWETVRWAAWHLWKNGRESMGAGILNVLLAVLTDMEEFLKQGTEMSQKWDRILGMLDYHVDNRNSMASRIKDSFVAYLRSQFLQSGGTRQKLTILTLSASSTIRDCIVDAYAALDIETLDLRILESRPLFEGVSIASSISTKFASQFQSAQNRNLQLSLYTDASAAVASSDVDVVLIGADRISATRGVSNKTGSLPAALSARYISPGVKVLVLSDSEKVKEPCVGEDDVEENDPVEVANTWRNDGVKGTQSIGGNATEGNVSTEVKNIYFEWVPLSLVDGFVCEEGILGKDGIRERSELIGKKIGRFFGYL